MCIIPYKPAERPPLLHVSKRLLDAGMVVRVCARCRCVTCHKITITVTLHLQLHTRSGRPPVRGAVRGWGTARRGNKDDSTGGGRAAAAMGSHSNTRERGRVRVYVKLCMHNA